jgi:hypothetical protein
MSIIFYYFWKCENIIERATDQFSDRILGMIIRMQISMVLQVIFNTNHILSEKTKRNTFHHLFFIIILSKINLCSQH